MTARWGDHVGRRPNPGGSTWADGYVVDTPYFEPVNVDVTPAWLSMVSVLNGQPPLDRSLTWLDLGAASGISACIVAAANSDVEVWGFDHNPGHVERGRSLASKAALTNCRFEEASFAQLASDRSIGPTEADVIVVSGVYSWVSKENQRHIAEVIRQRLRPGGLAYVMYATSTGWSAMVPLAEALRLLAEADGRRPDQAFHDAAATIKRLADAGADYFPLPPREAGIVEGWADANPHYAAHEYLGSHFGPLTFNEVAKVMSDARCTYLGNLDAVDHLPGYWTRPSLAGVVSATSDVVTRELLRDLAGQRPLRRDLYRRGLAITSVQQHRANVGSLRIMGLDKPFEEKPVPVLGGGVNVDPAYYEPLVGALGSQVLDIETIVDIHTGWTFDDAAGALAMLVAGGYATPLPEAPPTEEARSSSHRLNEVLVAENRMGADHACLASPVLGAGLDLDPVGVLAVGATWDEAEPTVDVLTESVLSTLEGLGRTVREDGKLVTDPERARSIAAERAARTLRLVELLDLG